jgi:hypothetical protein
VLDDHHTFVIPELPVQLPVANVERDDAKGSALQQYIGKSTSRCADIKALAPADLDVKRVECMSELESAAASVWMIGCDEGDRRLVVDSRACFCRRAIVDCDLSCENQRACTLARWSESTLDDELI